MEWLTLVLEVIILVGLGASALLAKKYLPSYVQEKAKNLATKEDIGAITNMIESVKTEYAKELEGLKSQLNAKFHAQTVRFEKEFDTYKEIWDSIVQFMDQIFELHIAVSIPDRRPDLHEADKKKFLQAIQNFYFAFEKNRPFFSPEVYNVITKLRHLQAIEKSITYSYLPTPTPEQSAEIKRLLEELLIGPADELMKTTDAIREAIRLRVEGF